MNTAKELSILNAMKRNKLKRLEQVSVSLPKKYISKYVQACQAATHAEKSELILDLCSDERFIDFQTDIFYRYIDGNNLLCLDLDKIEGALDVPKKVAKRLVTAFQDHTLPSGWKVTPVFGSGFNRYYKYIFKVTLPNTGKVRIFLLSKKDSIDFLQCRIEFIPNYVNRRGLKSFFNWLYVFLDNHLEQALSGSMMTRLDRGFQFHGLIQPIMNFDNPDATGYLKFPKNKDSDCLHVRESNYTLLGKDLNTSNQALYCSVSKLVNKSKSKKSQKLLPDILSQVQLSARLEDRWLFRPSTSTEKLNRVRFGALSDIPEQLSSLTLISPSIYKNLDLNLRSKLALEGYPQVFKTLNTSEIRSLSDVLRTSCLTIPKSKVDKLRNEVEPMVENILRGNFKLH